MGKKYIDNSWDFKNENTKNYTHCFHSYPAMMIPQVAGRLIDTYGQKSQYILDPYCGSGTSLVEANLRGIEAIGIDLNPLAILIAASKTTPINIKTLDLYLKDFNDVAFGYRFGLSSGMSIVLPQFPNIDYWFSKAVQHELSIIKNYIASIEEPAVQNFFKVAFSETVRECSWTMNSEFKLYRMPMKKLEAFNPNVLIVMESKLSRNRKGLVAYQKAKVDPATQTRLYTFNTVEGIPPTISSEAAVDMVVTSPPYGDSRTTVAYGQFSRLSNQWLDVGNASDVDKSLMGGRRAPNGHRFGIDILDRTLQKIGEQDEKRSKDVIAFFKDYETSIKHISKTIKPNGFACFVVGNRTVKNITIPTDEITRIFFEQNGFHHIETIIRNIPNKKMPLKNSPTNVVGKKSPTMKNEYIVISQKK